MARAEVGFRYNASIHYTKRIELVCRNANVKLAYLPLHSPNLNLIKEFFAKLNAFIKRNRHNYKENPEQGFNNFLEWCIDVVSAFSASSLTCCCCQA